jgi:hypothetical protein
MSRFSREVDFLFSHAGDFFIDSEKEDIQDTSLLLERSLIQRLNNQLRSSSNSWRLEPGVGAGIADLAGRANSSETGAELERRVLGAITGPSLLRPNEVKVEVFPLSETQVGIYIEVAPANGRAKLFFNYYYDVKDNVIVPRRY